jgi:hypothetical protein
MIERAHGMRWNEATACNQPLDFNLSERRGTARLMSAWEIYAQSQRFERDEGLRNDGRRRRKGDDVSNGAGGGSTAIRAVLEMSVRSRLVVRMMRGHLRLVSGGTHFQQERRTARRHEADGYIGPKQEDYQQQAGE